MLKKYFFSLFFSAFLCLFSLNNALAQVTEPPADNDKLSILTWNVYMLPRLVFHTGQLERARAIVDQLKDQNYDIVVFQETFDNKSRKIIWNGLKEKFPYQSGDPKHKHFYKVSTGIFIISKLPLEVIDDIYFSVCGGTDCYAVKGAVLVKVTKNNHTVQIIGTHLQSADGKKMTGQQIRKIQYEEIKEKLMIPHSEPGVPQFFVGDLNTSKDDKKSYDQLLATMEVEDGDITGGNQFSAVGGKNDLDISPNDKPHLIDYILCRRNGGFVSFTQRCVKIFQERWSKDHNDLSDHYAVLAEIELKPQ